MNNFKIHQIGHYYKIEYFAMASPCEVLVHSSDRLLVEHIAGIAIAETARIEGKFSRYKHDNLVSQMNSSNGLPVKIDHETFLLLEYAAQLFELSDGLFDISSGVLREIWQFIPNATPPTPQQIENILPYIGFQQISYNQHEFCMPEKMQIDFGGIGKEYCVDAVSKLIHPTCAEKLASYLVNFGGDLTAVSFSSKHPAWIVGLESVDGLSDVQSAQAVIEVSQGAIATSGNTKRVFSYNGKSYAHILNSKTGYPIENAPRSVSVFASTCSLAGGMSTLAQLQGENAERFLKACEVKYICNW